MASNLDVAALECVTSLGAQLNNVFTLRDEQDASQVVSALEGGAGDAVIIGGGYIGMEWYAIF